ncbi:MAG: tetratricopeptide repeat protein, partial [Nannocystaceae bacterium]
MRLLALEDPDAKSTVRELRDSLDHVFSLTTIGRPDEARTLLATTLARTKEVGYRPLLAEAEYARGLLEMSVGKDTEAAERALKEALWIAEEVRHDRISARAMAKFLRLVGIDQGRRDEAMRHVRHAEAILRRSDLSKGAHQELLESLSNLIYDDETNEADTGGVQEAFERAYTREKVRSPDQLSVTSSLRSLGEELVEEGELEKAVEHYARALEVARGQAGEDSPDVALLLGRLGDVHYELGDFRRAARTYLQAHRVYAGLVDATDARRVQMQLRLAEVATARRDFRKAGGYLLRVKRSGTRDPALLAEQRMLAAELLLARGRTKQANRAFEGLLRQLSKLPDAPEPEPTQLKESAEESG